MHLNDRLPQLWSFKDASIGSTERATFKTIATMPVDVRDAEAYELPPLRGSLPDGGPDDDIRDEAAGLLADEAKYPTRSQDKIGNEGDDELEGLAGDRTRLSVDEADIVGKGTNVETLIASVGISNQWLDVRSRLVVAEAKC